MDFDMVPDRLMQSQPSSSTLFARGVSDRQNKPLRAISIAEQIAEDLGADILNNRLAVGERLGEEMIAARFGVSRGPVRSALRILEKRGLATFFPRRGAFVAELTLENFRDVIEIRFWLLVLAAREAARNRTDAALEQVVNQVRILRSHIEESAVTPMKFALEISVMYQLVVDASDNKKLDGMLQETLDSTAWNLIWRNRELDYATPQRRREMVAIFDSLCQAIAGHDEDGAERAARLHLEDSLAVFFSRMKRRSG